jgi:hypothetical protein
MSLARRPLIELPTGGAMQMSAEMAPEEVFADAVNGDIEPGAFDVPAFLRRSES